jgi:hypothetical protein
MKINQGHVAMGAAFALLIICYFQQRELAKLRNEPKIEFYTGGDIQRGKIIDSLINLADSLETENYPCQIELNRFKVAFELFAKRYPKEASMYNDIISNETE